MVDGTHELYGAQMRWQIEVNDFVDVVLETVRALSTYAGAEFRYESRELAIFATEPASTDVTELLRRAPDSIHVTWLDAPYTHAELDAEVRRLIAARHGYPLNGIGARGDGTGINVATTDARLLAADDAHRLLGARYPVFVEYGVPAEPA